IGKLGMCCTRVGSRLKQSSSGTNHPNVALALAEPIAQCNIRSSTVSVAVMARSVGLLALLVVAPLASAAVSARGGQEACTAEDLRNRALLQNKLAGVCESMCREVEAYPACTCPNFVEPDSTPGLAAPAPASPDLGQYHDPSKPVG
ncbi:unnamed protein product, partial [Prorocentrum cordatum]